MLRSNQTDLELRRFVRRAKALLPDAVIAVDPPVAASGPFWVDVKWSGDITTISWTAERGFAFYAAEEAGYGEKPAYFRKDFKPALRELLRLVLEPKGLNVTTYLSGNVKRPGRLSGSFGVRSNVARPTRPSAHVGMKRVKQASIKKHQAERCVVDK